MCKMVFFNKVFLWRGWTVALSKQDREASGHTSLWISKLVAQELRYRRDRYLIDSGRLRFMSQKAYSNDDFLADILLALDEGRLRLKAD